MWLRVFQKEWIKLSQWQTKVCKTPEATRSWNNYRSTRTLISSFCQRTRSQKHVTSNSNLLHETLETCVRSTATFIHFANALKLAHYERSRMEAVAYGALKHRAKAYSTTTKINIHYAVKHITLTQPMLANFRYNSFLNSFRGVHRSRKYCNTGSMRGVDGASPYSISLFQKSI